MQQQQQQEQPSVSYPGTLSDLVAELARPDGPGMIDLNGQCLTGDVPTSTITISRPVTIQNGQLQLPPACSLVIKSAEVALQNVHLKGSLPPGGVLVDINKRSSVTLDRVMLVAEAQVSAASDGGVNASEGLTQQEGAGIRVHSGGALHADKTVIQAKHGHGLAVCDGGTLEAASCTMRACAGAGMVCDNAAAVLKHCKLESCRQSFVCRNAGVIDAYKCTSLGLSTPPAVLPQHVTFSIIGDSNFGQSSPQPGRDAQAQIFRKQSEQRTNEEQTRRLREQLKQEQSRSQKYKNRAEQAERRSEQLAVKVDALEQQLALVLELIPPEAPAAGGAEGPVATVMHDDQVGVFMSQRQGLQASSTSGDQACMSDKLCF
jgi:hypothetical protein